MLNEKEFIESQKECAKMLGMSLNEYKKYCKNVKVHNRESLSKEEGNTYKFLECLGIDKSILKTIK